MKFCFWRDRWSSCFYKCNQNSNYWTCLIFKRDPIYQTLFWFAQAARTYVRGGYFGVIGVIHWLITLVHSSRSLTWERQESSKEARDIIDDVSCSCSIYQTPMQSGREKNVRLRTIRALISIALILDFCLKLDSSFLNDDNHVFSMIQGMHDRYI